MPRGSHASRHDEASARFADQQIYPSDDQYSSRYIHDDRLGSGGYTSNRPSQNEYIIKTRYDSSPSQPAAGGYHDDRYLESSYDGGGDYPDHVFDDRSATSSPNPTHQVTAGSGHYLVSDSGVHRPQPHHHRPNSASSQYGESHRASGVSQSGLPRPDSVKTSTSRHGNVMVETMSAPHPCCPNTKGVCCLMILLNLSLILISLGFVIVLQLFRPPFVWYIGVILLVAGFASLIFCLVYCSWVCSGSRRYRSSNGQLYWTHHWRRQWGPNHPDAPGSVSTHKPCT